MDGPFNERVVFQLQDLSDIRQVPDHQVGFSDFFFFLGGGGFWCFRCNEITDIFIFYF